MIFFLRARPLLEAVLALILVGVVGFIYGSRPIPLSARGTGDPYAQTVVLSAFPMLVSMISIGVCSRRLQIERRPIRNLFLNHLTLSTLIVFLAFASLLPAVVSTSMATVGGLAKCISIPLSLGMAVGLFAGFELQVSAILTWWMACFAFGDPGWFLIKREFINLTSSNSACASILVLVMVAVLYSAKRSFPPNLFKIFRGRHERSSSAAVGWDGD